MHPMDQKKDDKWRELISTFIQIRQIFSQQPSCSFEKKLATMLQFEALDFIEKHAGNSMQETAAYLKTSISSTTQLITRLIKLGLVQRTVDKIDRRIVHLELTAEGRKEKERVEELIKAKMAGIFSRIPEQDINELIRIQKNIVTSLSNENI